MSGPQRRANMRALGIIMVAIGGLPALVYVVAGAIWSNHILSHHPALPLLLMAVIMVPLAGAYILGRNHE